MDDKIWRMGSVVFAFLVLIESTVAQTIPSPLVASGLKAWFRADLGVTKDGEGKVSQWVDIGGGGVHVAQSEPSRQPVWIPIGVGSQPAISFENSVLKSSLVNVMAGGNDVTVIAVVRPGLTQNPNGATILDYTQYGNPEGFAVAQQSTGAVNRFGLQWHSTAGGTGYSPSFQMGEEAQMVVFVKDGTTYSGYRNGELQISGTCNEQLDAPTLAEFGLGARATWHFNPFNGQISEIMVYNRALSAVERQQIEAGLTARYQLNDVDGDGLPDSWERMHSLNLTIDDSTQDLDGDGHSNLEEFIQGSNPNDSGDPAGPGPSVLPVYYADFESAEGYFIGSLDGQQGWTITQENATVMASASAPSGDYIVQLEENGEASWTWSPPLAGKIYVEIYAKVNPTSSYWTTTQIIVGGTKLFFIADGSEAQIWSGTYGSYYDDYNTSDTGARIPILLPGLSTGWHLYTFEIDQSLEYNRWNLYIDGEIVATDLLVDPEVVESIQLIASGDSRDQFDAMAIYIDLPRSLDQDGDQIPDLWEEWNGMNKADASDAAGDLDGDGLINIEEYRLGTIVNVYDTDGDGLADGQEVQFYHTNPLSFDTDNDGLSDSTEIALGYDPLVIDTNANGIADAEEDADSDGLSDYREILLGTNPSASDTDGDELSDVLELSKGMDPKVGNGNKDSDGDGISDVDEVQLGSSTRIADAIDEVGPYLGLILNQGNCSAVVTGLNNSGTVSVIQGSSTGGNSLTIFTGGEWKTLNSSFESRIPSISGLDDWSNEYLGDRYCTPSHPGFFRGLNDTDDVLVWDWSSSRYRIIDNNGRILESGNISPDPANWGGYARGWPSFFGGANKVFKAKNFGAIASRIPLQFGMVNGSNLSHNIFISSVASSAEDCVVRCLYGYNNTNVDPIFVPSSGALVFFPRQTLEGRINVTLPALSSFPNNVSSPISVLGLNDRRQAVGIVEYFDWNYSAYKSAAFKWDTVSNEITILGDDFDDESTGRPRYSAVSINNRGDVLGMAAEDGAAVWTSGVAMPIIDRVTNFEYLCNSAVPPEYFDSENFHQDLTDKRSWIPVAINDSRQIVLQSRSRVAILLTPVPKLWADVNRDGKIILNQFDLSTQESPLRFWINDDDDEGDEANQGGVTGNSDEPGRLSGWFEFDGRTPDHAHAGVDGRCDLIDFFPVYLDLKQLLTVLPPDSSLQYKLKQEDEALNFVYTDLTRETAFDYLTKEVATYGNGFNKLPHEAETVAISDEGVALSTAFLDKIKNGTSKGVLLFEATKASAKPLVLSVEKADGTVMTEVKLHLKIGEVEKMHRWINLRAEAGQAETRATSTAEPENCPDSTTNGKMFVFVHGYNVNERQSRAWNAEAFKRLYQSGSRAMFTAVTWHGDHSQIPLIGISPDYWENISNAFATAPILATAVNALPGSTKVIAGHSMGNMVVTSAIKDHGMNAYRYFMLNAAVALEAYDTSAMSIDAMTHQDWSAYNAQLWATEWHQLFDTGDGRRALTWRDRFGDLPNAINFYSSGEDVLNNNDAASGGTPGLVPDVGTEYSWVLQEMVKGTQHFGAVLTFDSQGGWGFNSAWNIAETVSNPGPHGSTTTTTYRRQTPAEADLLLSAPEQFKTKPFFRRFEDPRLMGASGSEAAAEYLTRATALGTAIPALSFAAGRNPVPRFNLDQRNINLVNLQDGWPQARLADPTKRITPAIGSWFHSDLKNVAYRYNYLMWENLVQKGALK